MIGRLIRRLTGRDYRMGLSDIPYVLAKGGVPYLRGALWAVLRFRAPRGLALGPYIQFIQGGRLKYGRGVAIGGFGYLDCSAEAGVILADRVTIRERVWIQGRNGLNRPAAGLWIGHRSYIGPNAVLGLGGPVRIGNDVQAGAGLSIAAESHESDAQGSFVSGHVSRRGVMIGDNCWLGNNVVILDGVTIGEGCIIGAGSVVTRSIPAFSLAFGVPACVRRSMVAEAGVD